jgi:hypothetical protein
MIALGSVVMVRVVDETAARFCAPVFGVSMNPAKKIELNKRRRGATRPVVKLCVLLESDNFIKPIHDGFDFFVRGFA